MTERIALVDVPDRLEQMEEREVDIDSEISALEDEREELVEKIARLKRASKRLESGELSIDGAIWLGDVCELCEDAPKQGYRHYCVECEAKFRSLVSQGKTLAQIAQGQEPVIFLFESLWERLHREKNA